MAIKKSRQMKVYGQSGYNYKSTPAIMLKGQWLKELGFEIGDYISVSCENGKLVITPDAERAALVEAEALWSRRRRSCRKGLKRRRQGSEHSLLLRGKWVWSMRNGKVYLVGATKGGVGKSVSIQNLK